MSNEPEALVLAAAHDRTVAIRKALNSGAHDNASRLAEATSAELRRLHTEHEADRAAMREALEVLQDGRDALQEQAEEFHRTMRGYKPERHKYMDEAVRRADAAIEKLKARSA